MTVSVIAFFPYFIFAFFAFFAFFVDDLKRAVYIVGVGKRNICLVIMASALVVAAVIEVNTARAEFR